MRKKNQVISIHEGIPSTFDWKKIDFFQPPLDCKNIR
jgi:hypothetical protein